MQVYGDLKKAAFESLSSDPAAAVTGRFWYNTTSLQIKVDDGSLVRALLRNDQNLVFGNSGTASSNVRVNRSGTALLQFVVGNDVTAEGSLSTTLAQLSFKTEGYTNAGKPAAGNAGRIIYITDTKAFQGDNGTAFVSLGGGGGGGAGASWQPIDGQAALDTIENFDKMFLFSVGLGQEISVSVRVPSSYVAGSPIKMRGSHYTPGTTGVYKFTATAILVRVGTDSIVTAPNSHASTNGDQSVPGSANVLTNVVYDLSDSSGLINGVTPSPGDVLQVILQRVTPSGTDDLNDVRFVPSSTEITFSN